MDVGDKEVQPAVVVHVEEASPPTDIRIAGLADFRGPAHVVESFLPQAVKQRIRLVLKLRNNEAHLPAVVVIAKVYSHVALLDPLPRQGHAAEHSYVRKRAVMIVVIEIIRR